MGDESAPTSVPTAVQQQSTQDLLADIFGMSNDEMTPSASPLASTTTPAPSATGQSSMQDIMGLFGSTSLESSNPAAAAHSPSEALFSTLDSPSIPSAAPRTSPPAATAALTAYDSNGLKITLTPSKDPSKANVLNILARFEANGGVLVEGVSFQAAVPKVRGAVSFRSRPSLSRL